MTGYLRIKNLGKAYKRYPLKRGRAMEWLGMGVQHELKWVLRDISFDVAPGDSVGIVGVNGAGKSTLLKMITGTNHPTTGSIEVGGKHPALLDLGMGFHPDFTGRQNVYLAAQLLGMSSDEIGGMIPKIQEFAQIGDYFDQPTRTYSSGMYMRLAFSVATANRPDVLIIDEALSVGDAAFQRKCFQRIEDYLSSGTTFLFVSHDIETVKKLCTRALFIKDGRLQSFGAAKQVCDEYEKYLFGDRGTVSQQSAGEAVVPAAETAKFDPSIVASCELSYGNGKADIVSCWLEDTAGQKINVVESGTPFHWCYRVRFNQDIDKPIFAMMLKTLEGIALYGVDSTTLGMNPGPFCDGDVADVRFSLTNVLAPGVYYLNCGVRLRYQAGDEFLSRRVDSAILRVIAGARATAVLGVVEMSSILQIANVDAVDG